MQIGKAEIHPVADTLSYDDILLLPSYSEVLPGDVKIRTRLAGDIYLNTPILSAAMDTVTEDELAIAMALEGAQGLSTEIFLPRSRPGKPAGSSGF